VVSNPNYRHLYRTPDGHLKLPFVHLGLFLRVNQIKVGVSEARAIENMVQFLHSLMIFSRRLRSHLESYRPDSWTDVPYHELFLDTQSLFLFVQQFLEDVALIMRTALPHTQRHQMPPAFRDLSKRFREKTLRAEEPLKIFLDTEAPWFNEIGDLRDDICHRTAFDKSRAVTFPGLMDVLRAGSGKAPFASGADLRSYMSGVFSRTLAFACVAEQFVYRQMTAQYPEHAISLPPAYIVEENEIDLARISGEPQFPVGTIVMTVNKTTLENLDYFLRPAENTG
jgi:hypothetical protein